MSLKNSVERKVKTPLTIKQVKELLNQSKGISEHVCNGLALMAIFGLRVSEVLSIRIENIDLEKKIFQIDNVGRKPLLIPIPSNVISLLKHQIELVNNSKYLFPSLKDNKMAMTRSSFSYLVHKALKPSGVLTTLFNFHNLRLFCKRFMWEVGFTQFVVSKSLNEKCNPLGLFDFDYLEVHCEIYETIAKNILPDDFSCNEVTSIKGI